MKNRLLNIIFSVGICFLIYSGTAISNEKNYGEDVKLCKLRLAISVPEECGDYSVTYLGISSIVIWGEEDIGGSWGHKTEWLFQLVVGGNSNKLYFPITYTTGKHIHYSTYKVKWEHFEPLFPIGKFKLISIDHDSMEIVIDYSK